MQLLYLLVVVAVSDVSDGNAVIFAADKLLNYYMSSK